MSTNTRTVTFAGGETRPLPGGRFLYIKAATAAIDIEITDRNGTPNSITGATAGMKFKRLDGEAWRYTKITSAAAQIVVVVLSDDAEVDIASTVTVAGAVTVAEIPSSAVATPARATRATGGADTIAANPARKRITISNPSDNATPGLLYVQATGAGAGRGYPLDSGLSAEFRTTAALDVRNDSGVSVDYTVFEET